MKKLAFFVFIASLFNVSLVEAQCPTADAGPDMIQCSSPYFPLNGTVTNGGTVQWRTSSFGGTFAPNASVLVSTYTVGGAGAYENYSSLILKTTKAGCPDVEDTMYVFYDCPIVVRNGFPPSQSSCCVFDASYLTQTTVCSDNPSVNVYGVVYMGDPFLGTSYGPNPITWPNTGTWTTSGTGTFTDIDSVNTTYNFSSDDVLTGSVVLTLTSTDMGDCVNPLSSITVMIETCTGISGGQTKKENMINIYPNPAREWFSIESSLKDPHYTLIDLSGKIICQGKAENNAINVSGLEKGVYMLKLNNSEGIHYKKLMIE
jgi:hypothetical protein